MNQALQVMAGRRRCQIPAVNCRSN